MPDPTRPADDRPLLSAMEDVPLTFASRTPATPGPDDPLRFADGPGTWVETDIAAPPETVWGLVSDIDLPGRFSAEFLGATWQADGPGLGAAFVGRNVHPDVGEWEITSFVDAYEPCRTFGWGTVDADNPGSRWRFDLDPTASGTRLRFSVAFGPGPSFLTVVIDQMPDKEERIIRRRLREHHANMGRTVAGIAELAEAAPTPDPPEAAAARPTA